MAEEKTSSDAPKGTGFYTPAPPPFSPAPKGTGFVSQGGGNSGGGASQISSPAPTGTGYVSQAPTASVKTFEQSSPKAQVEFLNKIQPAQVQAQARLADENAISLSLGLQGAQVPKETLAAYAGMASMREKRAEGVIRGAALQEGAGGTGSDVIYRQGTFSPMSSERLGQVEKTGGSFFFSSGELPPQNERNIGGLPQYEFKPPSVGNNAIIYTPKDNGLFTPVQKTSPKFEMQGATQFGGFSSISGMEINYVAPAPLASVEPSNSEYGYSTYYKPTIGKKEAQSFSPTLPENVAGEGMSVQITPPKEQVGMSVMPKEDIPHKVLGGLSINQFQQELNLAPTANAFGVSPGFVRNMVNNPGTYKSEATGTILSSYAFTNAKGEKMVGFGNAVRDYSLLPATPPERTQRLLTPFEEAGAKANTGDIVGGLFPAAKFVNLGLPEGKKLEYKSPTFRVATDLGLSMVGIAGKEGAKLTAGSYYRFSPVEFQTEKQLQEFKASPQKQAAYKQLAAGQLESGRQESAVNIATVGAFEIAGAAAPLVRGSSVLKNVPFIGKAYVPEKAGVSYVSSLAKGEAREGVFNPRFITKDSVVQYIPDKPGIFNRVGSNIITENPASMTTRVVSSKAIDKLPAAIVTSRGIFTDITEGAAVKLKLTTTVYSTEGTSVGSFTTGYSVRGDIYGQKGTLTSGMGDLATIEQNMIFIPKRGEAEFYKFTNTGTAASSMSIPIEGFGVGRSQGSRSVFSTQNIIGIKQSDYGYTLVRSSRQMYDKGFTSFGTIKTQEGKPVAMVEYFSKTEPQTVELLPEPRAYRAGGRGSMKPMAIQVQVQSVPTALKYAPTTKATPSVQIQKTVTQPTAMAFSASDYDKQYSVEVSRTTPSLKVGSLGGQMPSMKINQPTGLKEYFQPATASKASQSPAQKFYQPTDTGLKGYVGGGLKVYTPQETPQKTYQPTAQNVYQAQPQATRTMFATPNIPFIGTPNVKVPYQPPKQPPFFPLSFMGGDMSGGFEFGKKTKREKGKYSPSFIAVTLGIRGKPGKSEMSGFAIRPMALAGKKRGRK